MSADDEALIERILSARVRSMVEGEFDVREHRLTQTERRLDRAVKDRLDKLDQLIHQAESLITLLAESAGVPVDRTVEGYIDERITRNQQTVINAVYDRLDAIVSNYMYLHEEELGNGTDTTT